MTVTWIYFTQEQVLGRWGTGACGDYVIIQVGTTWEGTEKWWAKRVECGHTNCGVRYCRQLAKRLLRTWKSRKSDGWIWHSVGERVGEWQQSGSLKVMGGGGGGGGMWHQCKMVMMGNSVKRLNKIR